MYFQLLSKRQPMFECLVQGCPFKAQHRRGRHEHLVSVHSFPEDFRFSAVVGKKSRQRRRKPKKAQKSDSAAADAEGDAAMEEPPATAAAAAAAPATAPATEDVDMAPAHDNPYLAQGTGDRRVPNHISFGRGRSGFIRGGGRGRGRGRSRGRGHAQGADGAAGDAGPQCFRCKQRGHLKRDCPLKTQPDAMVQ